jgi:hypothetical protein
MEFLQKESVFLHCYCQCLEDIFQHSSTPIFAWRVSVCALGFTVVVSTLPGLVPFSCAPTVWHTVCSSKHLPHFCSSLDICGSLLLDCGLCSDKINTGRSQVARRGAGNTFRLNVSRKLLPSSLYR